MLKEVKYMNRSKFRDDFNRTEIRSMINLAAMFCHFPFIFLLAIICKPLISCWLLNLQLESSISPIYVSNFPPSLARTIIYMLPKPICL